MRMGALNLRMQLKRRLWWIIRILKISSNLRTYVLPVVTSLILPMMNDIMFVDLYISRGKVTSNINE